MHRLPIFLSSFSGMSRERQLVREMFDRLQSERVYWDC